jgi:SPP1 gp7 family putative phage head morphogenesis protein
MRKLTEVPASLKNINLEAMLRSRGIYMKQRINREAKELVTPMAKAILNSKKKKVEPQIYAHFSNQDALDYWEKQIHIVEILEKRFDLKVQQFITKMVDNFLNHLDTEITEKNLNKYRAKGYFDDNEDDLLVKAQLDFTPLLIDQAVLAGQEALRLINSKDIYTPYELRAQIAENVAKFTQSMLETDRQTLIDIIKDGIDTGKSIPEIRGMIQTSFSDISKKQAQVITRTEVLRASNQAALDAYKQSGVVEGKQWLTAGATDECAQYEGQIESLDGSFYSDTTQFKDGDPPLHPNCRCVLLPVLISEGKIYTPSNEGLKQYVAELESQVDKRSKEFKKLKQLKQDDEVYIKSLEKYLGVADEPKR